MLNLMQLTWQSLKREVRSGEWIIIFIALILAVTTITSLHFYIDRIQRALINQSAIFLGGNLAFVSPRPIEPQLENQAHNLGLKTAMVLSYPSMASANDKMQMVTVQAVSSSFPIVGDGSRPQKNQVFVEPRSLTSLGVGIGSLIKIGVQYFKIEKKISQDLNTLQTSTLIAPRLLMRLEDVAETQTVLPGSRVEYRLLVTGTDTNLKSFQQFLVKQLKPNERILTAKNTQAFLSDAISRFENYLNFILGLALLMAGIAILISATEYLRRHTIDAGMWRCLGASKWQLMSVMMIQLGVIGTVAITIGCFFGYLLQIGLEHLFQNVIPFSLPSISMWPIFIGTIVGYVLLFTCTFPLISVLPQTPPITIWRNDVIPKAHSQSSLIFLIISLVLFALFFLQRNLLTLLLIDIVIISIAALYALAIFYLKVIKRLSLKTQGVVRRGLSQFIQHSNQASLQFISFSLIIALLIMLSSIKNAMLYDWQQTLPPNTPNYFVFNLSADDVTILQNFWKEKAIKVEDVYPMVRGRLVQLNNQPIFSVIPVKAHNHNALHRELNLSFMEKLPADNKIVAGRAFNAKDNGKLLVSVENDLAKDLHLKLGDDLTFLVGDKKITASILNFRTLQWSSFHPNFFMIFPPDTLTEFPITYISSFYLDEQQIPYLNEMLVRMPNITLIDVASLLSQVKKIVGTMVFALQFLFVLCLTLGSLIFLASLQATKGERLQNSKLLRLLGANKSYIKRSQWVEFATLFLLIGLNAMIIGKVGSYIVVRNFFNF